MADAIKGGEDGDLVTLVDSIFEKARKQVEEKSNREQALVEEIKGKTGEQVCLDIGGVKQITVNKDLLLKVPDSALEAMFSGRHAIAVNDGKVFIDRDHEPFEQVINYLRNGLKRPKFTSEHEKELFELELDYWQIKPLPSSKEKLISFFESDPEYLPYNVKSCWRKLGRFDLQDMLDRKMLDGFGENADDELEASELRIVEEYEIIAKYGDKFIYWGQMNEKNEYHGIGRLISGDGRIFEG